MKALIKQVRDSVGPRFYPMLKPLGLPRQVYQHLPFFGAFSVEAAPGARFTVESKGSIVENELFWRGFGKSWEKASLQAWMEHARHASGILDIGANTGIFSLAARSINPRAAITAFEPSASTARQLRRNIALNGYDIRVEELAASDHEGEETFYDVPGEIQYSASLERGMGGTIEVRVPVRRVDDLIDSKVDLVKIDVEMHEPAVLRGMRKILERDRPVMLVEILTDEVRAGVEAALAGLGYRWTLLDDDEAYSNFLLEPAKN